MSLAISSTVDARDAGFLRTFATVMAVILVSGFIVNLALGRSSFASPVVVHLHGMLFMGWAAIVLTQFWLAASGAIALHRYLGLLAVAWSGAMMVLGPWVTIAAVQTGRVPFFFQPQHFLLADPATLIAFFGLFAAAVALRRHTDWHQRLQLGAFVALMGPGVGRLLPMPLLIPFAFEVAAAVPLLVPLIGIWRDRRVHGRAHPAWFWAIGAILLALTAARLLAFSGVGESFYAMITAGTPMAGSDGRAFPPAPF